MKVFIAYGWPEGEWHGRRLREALKNAGYTVTSSPKDADVIVTHSAGCYMLPSDVRARLIMLVGLPNWSRPLIKCTFAKIRLEHKNIEWLHKTLLHTFYAVSQPIRLYKVYRAFRKKYLPDFSSSKVLLIRNEQDTYMEEEASERLARKRGWLYQNLKGQHDDLWEDPQAYIEIINLALDRG